MAERNYEIDGRIHAVSPIKQISDSFWLREFVMVIDEDTDYPQYIKMQLCKDKADLLCEDDIGKDAVAFFNLRGKLYNDKNTGQETAFTNIDAWRLTLMAADNGRPTETYEATQDQATTAFAQDESGNDIPDPEQLDHIPF